MASVHICSFEALDALSRAVAEALTERVNEVLARQPRCTLALAGGSTPRRLYELLADPYRDRLPWDRIHLFFGDERFVPPDHPESNYGMAHEVLLQHISIPPDQIHPIPTGAASPEAAAKAYEATLRRTFGTSASTFNLTLLGLGADGHTASLFPGEAPQRSVTNCLVEAVVAPPSYPTRSRITLTLPALNASQHVFFLVAGAEKHDALRAILGGSGTSLPAAHVRARHTLTWFVDEAAFGGS